MRTKSIIIILISLMAVTAMVFQSCKKDDPNDPIEPTPPVYNDGQGEIGTIGGTIRIEDPQSPINGASIVIPEGALSSTINFTIVQPDSVYYINGSQDHLLIDIQPSGIHFDEPVVIGIPYYSFENEKYFKPFYYNNKTDEIEELESVELDKENKIFYAKTNHTSIYFNDEMVMDIEMVKVDDGGTTRVAAFANIRTAFENLPTKWQYAGHGYPNALSILYSPHVPGVGSNYKMRLYKTGNNNSLAELELEVWINQTSSGDNTGAAQVGEWIGSNYEFIFQKQFLDKAYIADTWMSGYPLLFTFKNFEPNNSDKYYVTLTWVEEKTETYKRFTDTYLLNNKVDAVTIGNMYWEDGDSDINFILDEYDGGGGVNQAPNQPTLVTPSNGSTTNTNIILKWNCSDPDGDYLTYDIYLDEDYPPTLFEATNISNKYLAVNDLEPATTYYWAVNAFDDNHTTEGPVWEFTTSENGSNTPPVAYFTVSPSNGSTNDIYNFNASGCSDNEDPTDLLKVRWDYDGDGYWDTNWHGDKTQNHQYTNEGVYNAKLEVKDTEGLTDQYSKSITVDNGGGGNEPPNQPTDESPSNNATNISVDANLSWTCSDPEGDQLDYNIYFGTSDNPPKVEEYYTSTTFNPGDLDENTTYYWQIKAYEVDNNNNFSESPVWQFTTEGGSNSPVADFSTDITTGPAPLSVNFTDQSTNNPTTWQWEFGDGGTSTQQTPSHTYNIDGYYTVSLTVTNEDGSDIKTLDNYIYVGSMGEPCPDTPTVTDADGNVYNTVQIGGKCWMKENLNVGIRIDGSENMTEDNVTEKYCYRDDPANCEIYGGLYQWGEVMRYTTDEGVQGICPDNWHIPTDDEWKQMEMALGMSQSEADKEGWRGTDEGDKMKSTSGWTGSGNGTNYSGFNALPGGVRYYPLDNHFNGLGYKTTWCSSTFAGGSGGGPYRRELRSGGQVHRQYYYTLVGYSIRCVKD